MGTWGAGNFDNDGALNSMSEVVQRLVDLATRIHGRSLCMAGACTNQVQRIGCCDAPTTTPSQRSWSSWRSSWRHGEHLACQPGLGSADHDIDRIADGLG